METLTICCIGTDHDRQEDWTLMRAVSDLVEAEDVPPWEVPTSSPTAKHVKVLYDGPEVVLTSNKYLRDRQKDAVDFVVRQALAGRKPKRMFLLGHSRGAVLSLMIAARLFHTPETRDIPVLLWLLDVVAVTDERGGLGNAIGRVDSLTVYPNVDRMVRVVMEDDNSPAFFPVEEIRVDRQDGGFLLLDHEHATRHGRRKRPYITFIRMPGTHGTGTQVNPVARDGTTLERDEKSHARRGILTSTPGRAWPIGEVCLINALRAIRDAPWPGKPDSGMPLTREGRAFAGSVDGDTLLASYARIPVHNWRSADGAIQVNDLARSFVPLGVPRKLKSEKQRILRKQGSRSDRELRPFGRDLRQNTQVVNDQHSALLQALFGTDRALELEQYGEQTSWPAGVPDDRALQTLDEIREGRPGQAFLLEMALLRYRGLELPTTDAG